MAAPPDWAVFLSDKDLSSTISLDRSVIAVYITRWLYMEMVSLVSTSERLDATSQRWRTYAASHSARLAKGEASVNELAEPFAMSQPAISKHLRVLERAALISRGHEAQRRPRKLEAKPMAEANAWLEKYRQFWKRIFSDSMHCSKNCNSRTRTSTNRPRRGKGRLNRPGQKTLSKGNETI